MENTKDNLADAMLCYSSHKFMLSECTGGVVWPQYNTYILALGDEIGRLRGSYNDAQDQIAYLEEHVKHLETDLENAQDQIDFHQITIDTFESAYLI